MKKLFFSLLFFLAFASTSYGAANSSLCDASCNLTISFPDGGAITAIEPLTIVFGESGFINDGATTTGYPAGDTISLAAGESLSFAAGGALSLGTAGNIDYTSMRIDTSGEIDITAVGGAEQITIRDMELTGGTLVLNAVSTIWGGVDAINANIFVNAGIMPIDSTNGQQTAGCNSTSGSYGGGVTISSGVTLADPTGCINTTNNITIDPNFLTGTLTIQGGGTLTLNDGVDLVNASGDVTPISGGFFVANLSQQSLAEMEGFPLLTSDGNTCTVTNGECIAASGAKYVVNTDGELVPADDGGAINLYLLLMMAMLLFGRYSFLCMRQC